MPSSLLRIDVRSLVEVKRRLVQEAAGLTSNQDASRVVREFVQAIEEIAEPEPRAALLLLLTTAEELCQAAGLSPEYTSRLHALMALPGATLREMIVQFETALTVMLELRSAPATSDRVRTILDIIERRYVEPLTIDELAGHVSRGRARVASQFRRETGLTIHRYLTQVRMRRAVELLERGEKVEAVMLLVGYRSKKSFYFHFRAHTGRTPGCFRRQPLCAPAAAPPEQRDRR